MLTTEEIVERLERAAYFLRQAGYHQPATDLLDIRLQLTAMDEMTNNLAEEVKGCLQ